MKRLLIFFSFIFIYLLTGCDSSDSDQQAIQTDYSGTYCIGEFNKLIVDNSSGVETYSVVLQGFDPFPVSAVGVRNGDNLTISAVIDGFNVDYYYTFYDNAMSLSGYFQVVFGSELFVINEHGTKGDCNTIDVDAGELPGFISQDFVNLNDDIVDVSLFRSSAGHDYSDRFESCRSMKHYFVPSIDKRVNDTVPIYSPIDGQVESLYAEEESFSDDGVTNQKVTIRSDDYPGLLVILFHVDLSSSSVVVGTSVSAGQQLGFARLERNGSIGHDFDIAIHVNTATGVKYVPYFDAMTDGLFNSYITWGGGGITRDAFMISESARDADPLTCVNETFTTFGSLPNWYSDLP